jgi:hypothetical protein
MVNNKRKCLFTLKVTEVQVYKWRVVKEMTKTATPVRNVKDEKKILFIRERENVVSRGCHCQAAIFLLIIKLPTK